MLSTVLTFLVLFATSSVAGDNLRTFSGQHIKLTTDITSDTASEEVASLPAVFDSDVARWCDWFGVNPAAVATWQVNAVLIGDERHFVGTTLLRDMPPLRHGFAWQDRIWLRNQASHTANTTLILHEGVHLFVEHYKLGTSPAWYHEGIADWLTLSPQNAAAGRIATLQREVAAGRIRGIGEVQRFTRNNFDADDSLPYAWSWALCAFLAEHPQHSDFSDFFRSLATTIPEEHRNERLSILIATKRFAIVRAWVAWLCDLDSKDIFQSGRIPKSGINETQQELRNDFEIASSGWHATGFIVEAGKPITLKVTGKCDLEAVVVSDEPNQPLAVLAKIFSNPVAIGTNKTWTPQTRGRLLLRIADKHNNFSNNPAGCRVIVDLPVE